MIRLDSISRTNPLFMSMSRKYTQECFIVQLPLHAFSNFLEYITSIDGVKRSGNWDRCIEIHELVPAGEKDPACPRDTPWRLIIQPYLTEESRLSADDLVEDVEESLLHALKKKTACKEPWLRVRRVRRENLTHLPETKHYPDNAFDRQVLV